MLERAYGWLKCKLGINNQLPATDRILQLLIGLKDDLQDIKRDLRIEKEFLQKEVAKREAIINTMLETLPDMVWMKDKEGKYMYANKAIRDGLLFCENPIGKNDVELAKKAKERFGYKNHTFGEVCVNSDTVVLDNMHKQRFMEKGKVMGKMMHLEVHKAPVVFDGEVIGVCGSGRDMTEYSEAYLAHGCSKCPLMEDVFAKYEFVNNEEK